jgi:putative PIN family toxin of toxin-antitoxin system
MSAPPRKTIVVDTNVLIRATFRKRSPLSHRIYQAIAAQECLLAISPAIVEEIRDVISRDSIIAFTHTTPQLRRQYLSALLAISILTPGKAKLTKTSRDVKDNKFLVCATEAKADYLITSDEDLLTLKEYASTRILPPHEFVKLLETGTL